MPIPLGYSRHVLEGHLSNGEKFQTGFWVSQAPSDAAAATTDAQAVATYLNAHWTDASSPVSMLATGSGYDKVKVYSYPNGGPDASFVGEAALTGAAGAGTQNAPNQLAACLTLETGLSGRTHRGRMFLPFNKVVTLTSGQMTTTETDAYLVWWKATMDGINSTVAPGFVVVLSQKLGTAQRVTSLRMDTRLDIQRRRADRENIIGVSTTTL